MKKAKTNLLYYSYLGILMIAQLLTMFFLLSHTSIDNDDMCQIAVSISSPFSRIMELLLETDNNPPLFTLFASLWIRIVPYGSAWLKLLSQIFLIAATGIMGHIGYRYGNVLTGIFSSIFSATCTLLVYCCADAFRPYGLLFLTGSIILSAYLNRRDHQETTGSLIYYGISVALVAYTHYFGVLTCFALFLFDVILFLRKKISIKVILCYILAGISYIPWLIPVIQVKLATAGSFWPEIPTWRRIYTNCYNKYFDTSLNILIMIIFLGIMFLQYRSNKKQMTPDSAGLSDSSRQTVPNLQDSEQKHFPLESILLCLWVPFVVTMIDFLYSAYVNPKGSMWVERYFIVVYPFSFLLIGVSWNYIFQTVRNWLACHSEQTKKYVSAFTYASYVVITLYLMIQVRQFVNTCQYIGSTSEQPFQELCEYLVTQDDFFDDTTGFLPTFKNEKKAYHYFFTKHDTEEIADFNWIPNPMERPSDLDSYETIYLAQISTPFDEATKAALEADFTQIDEIKVLHLTKWIRN